MRSNAFTLVELLIVIAIMGFLGVGIALQQTLSKEDIDLKLKAADLQSFIRVAQTNATARVLCNNVGGAYWLIRPINIKTLELRCYTTDPATTYLEKTYTLSDNIEMVSIMGSSGCNSNFTIQTLQVKFTPLSAKPAFESAVACVPSSPYLDIKIRNTKTLDETTVTIDKGGMVDVK